MAGEGGKGFVARALNSSCIECCFIIIFSRLFHCKESEQLVQQTRAHYDYYLAYTRLAGNETALVGQLKDLGYVMRLP